MGAHAGSYWNHIERCASMVARTNSAFTRRIRSIHHRGGACLPFPQFFFSNSILSIVHRFHAMRERRTSGLRRNACSTRLWYAAYAMLMPLPSLHRRVPLYLSILSFFFLECHADIPRDRDGYSASPNDIFLTAGASAGISLLINLLITDPTSGILIPIPQHLVCGLGDSNIK